MLSRDARRAEGEAAASSSSPSVDPSPPPPPSPSIAASPHWGKSAAAERAGPEGFSPLVGFCFAINYILGTGFLTVPWAFVEGGLVLSTMSIVAVGLCSDVAKDFLLEAMARAEEMLDDRMHWIKRRPGDEERERLVYSPAIAGRRESSELLPPEEAGRRDYESVSEPTSAGCELATRSLPGTPISSQPGTPTFARGRMFMRRPPRKYLVKHRKFEVNSLCRVFLGKAGLRLYAASICLYIYCTLWAYACVFAGAMSKAFPLLDDDEDADYLIYALVFAAAVVPLSCMELHEQVTVQVVMTGARFLMLGLMAGTSGMCARDVAGNVTSEGRALEEAPMVRLAGVPKMAPIMVFAHIYHHSIPGLAHPVADKKKLGGMFRSTTVFSTIAYATIGLILGSNFGNGVEQSSNLNWKEFTGGTAVYGDDGRVLSVAWWARAISLYVLCFPALDVVSAFPLNAITLGNNVMGSVYGRRILEVEKNRFVRTQFRLLASVPPILFAVLERQLGTITDYAGTTGFVIGFSFPALLYLRSGALAERKHFSSKTFYSGYASSARAGWLLFSFGIAMVAYVASFLVKDEETDAES